MPGRNYNGNAYRYGFNGKENDNDVKNITGSQQDYGFRIYDTRLGRFLSVDPLTKSYPELTPYQFASNRPIDGIDWDGLEYRNPMQAAESSSPIAYGVATAADIGANVLKGFAATFGALTQLFDDINSSNLKRTPAQKVEFEARAKNNAKTLITDGIIGLGVGKIIGVASSTITKSSGEAFASQAGNVTKSTLEGNSSLQKSFSGAKYDLAEAAADLDVYRVSSTNVAEGEFFTTIKPTSSSQAVESLNLGVTGNTANYVTPVTISKGSQFAIGGIEGGSANQIYIPKAVQNAGGNKVIYGTPEKLPTKKGN